MKTYSISSNSTLSHKKADYVLVNQAGSIIFYANPKGNILDTVIAVYPSTTIVKEV